MEGIQISGKQTGEDDNIYIKKVGGYSDKNTHAKLEHSLDQLMEEKKHRIIINLQNVEYISSAGWGIFISEIKGIREKGGDLKLVSMVPEVYEVFELLEFHFILKAFDTIEEAIADFDKDIVQVETETVSTAESEEKGEVLKGVATSETLAETEERKTYLENMINRKAEDKSVEDKIRQLVIENPENGSISIMRELKSEKYGNLKLNWFQVKKYLKQMDLNTKKKRVEFFKNKAFK